MLLKYSLTFSNKHLDSNYNIDCWLVRLWRQVVKVTLASDVHLSLFTVEGK